MPTLELNLDGLDMARGHDGLLRGAPEPVVIFGIYAVAGKKAALLRREIVAFAAKSRFPSFVAGRLSTSHSVAHVERFVILLAALEEDAGDDIQRAYGALESVSRLHVWSHDHDGPEPHALHELRSGSGWAMPQRCELEDETGPFSGSCKRDKWVGASAWVSESAHPSLDLRFHVRSEDRKNDWTVLLEVKHS